jgi:HK97 gp10 family phage protein
MMQVKLEGFKELAAALDNLPGRVEDKVLQSAVTGAIRQAGKEIRKDAPRSEEQSTASLKYGRLSKNIKISRVRSAKKRGKGAKITIGDAFWGFFYERGTRYQPARPWFVPAFDRARAAMLSELSKRIKEGTEKEFQKMVKK